MHTEISVLKHPGPRENSSNGPIKFPREAVVVPPFFLPQLFGLRQRIEELLLRLVQNADLELAVHGRDGLMVGKSENFSHLLLNGWLVLSEATVKHPCGRGTDHTGHDTDIPVRLSLVEDDGARRKGSECLFGGEGAMDELLDEPGEPLEGKRRQPLPI